MLSNDFNKFIVDHLNDPVVMFDRNGQIFYCNNRFSEVYKTEKIHTSVRNLKEWIASSVELSDIIDNDLKDSFFEKTINMIEERKHAIVKFGPLVNENGVFGGYMIITNITKALENILEYEGRLRKLINTAGIGVVILNQKHAVIDTNMRFANMLGYTIDEMYDLHIWDWDADMSREEILINFNDLSGLETVFETRHRRKDGSIYDVEVSAYGASLDSSEGKYNASICICRDITKQKEIEKQLKISEARYRNLVENGSEIIFSATEDETILYVSPNCKLITGYEPEEITGNKISEFFSYGQPDCMEAVFEQCSYSESCSSGDLLLYHKDGTYNGI